MYFSKEALQELKEGEAAVAAKAQGLKESLIARKYKTARAKEFAEHGLCRRLDSLARAIEVVFGMLPPEQEEAPELETLRDATLVIQAFVFNVFGALDNLAWIWVTENGVTKTDGSQLPDTWVGFGKKNTLVRESLPKELRTYLSALSDWFDQLESFRHALAHRVPLYIVPYIVPDDRHDAYVALETRKAQSKDLAEYNRLKAEQLKLVTFAPWMTHSFSENAKRVVFHPQMLGDFNTIEELTRKILAELDQTGGAAGNAEVPEAFVQRFVAWLGRLWGQLWGRMGRFIRYVDHRQRFPGCVANCLD